MSTLHLAFCKIAGAIESTVGYKPQQLPERVPHLKERTYVCGFL